MRYLAVSVLSLFLGFPGAFADHHEAKSECSCSEKCATECKEGKTDHCKCKDASCDKCKKCGCHDKKAETKAEPKKK